MWFRCSQRKMAELFENNRYPDQMICSILSESALFANYPFGFSRLKWVQNCKNLIWLTICTQSAGTVTRWPLVREILISSWSGKSRGIQNSQGNFKYQEYHGKVREFPNFGPKLFGRGRYMYFIHSKWLKNLYFFFSLTQHYYKLILIYVSPKTLKHFIFELNN